MIIISSIVIFILLCVCLFVGLLFQKRNKKGFKYVEISMDYFLFCFFMFMAFVIYVVSIMVLECNDLLAILLLVGLIILASKFSFLCMKEETIKSAGEKELLVHVAIVALALAFGILGLLENEEIYYSYMYKILATSVGFFVSLKVLVEKKTLKEQIKELCSNFGMKQFKRVIIPALVIFFILIGTFIFNENVSEQMQELIYYGIVLGGLLFVLFCIFLFKNRKAWGFINKFFFEKR